MKIQPGTIVIFIHIFLTLVYAIFILSRKSHLQKEHMIPLFIIPVFGPFTALMIEFMILSGEQGKKHPELDSVTLDDDILWTTLKSFHEKGDLVPLEEAILINEVEVRRRFMLETLYADPFKYLDVLSIAKYNEDVETSHYATTTISKAQKDFQLSIQKYAVEVENHPDDPEVLNDYIEMLCKYIQSGLLEEHLLKNLRIVYSKTLDRKLNLMKNDKNALIEKLRNALELKEYTSAFETSDRLKKYWPEDEQTWIEVLRAGVEGKDRTRLKETIEEIQNKGVIWTRQGREQVNIWLKTDFSVYGIAQAEPTPASTPDASISTTDTGSNPLFTPPP